MVTLLNQTKNSNSVPRLLAAPAFDMIFLILGRACNMSCAYCLQHGLVHTAMADISNKVYDFVRSLARRQSRLRLQFYGGEPLVYFETMQTVVTELSDVRDKLVLTMITNGRALDDDVVDWCNANLDAVAVSWDGPVASSTTRGYDVMHERREQLLRLNNLSFTAVLSAATFPLDVFDAVDEFNLDYAKLHKGALAGVNLDELLCTTPAHPELADIDFDKLRVQVQVIADEYGDHVVKGKAMSASRLAWITSKVNNLKHGVRNGVNDKARCGNGYNVLNLDGAGNLYACHNGDTVVGTIDDTWTTVLRNVVLHDRAPLHATGACSKCGLQLMCQNGCPLVTAEDRRRYYCRQVAALDEPVIDKVLELGQQLGGGEQ